MNLPKDEIFMGLRIPSQLRNHNLKYENKKAIKCLTSVISFLIQLKITSKKDIQHYGVIKVKDYASASIIIKLICLSPKIAF